MSERHPPARSENGPLRIGILAPHDLEFDFWERRLFEKLAVDPRFEIAALIIDGNVPPSRKPLLQRLQNPRLPDIAIRRITSLFDRRAMTPEPVIETPAFEQQLANIPHLTVKPLKNGYVDRFTEDDVARIHDLGLDVILRHAFAILKGEVLEAARFGIWSFHHGDNAVNRGSPPGYWESAFSEPMTGRASAPNTACMLRISVASPTAVPVAWHSTSERSAGAHPAAA